MPDALRVPGAALDGMTYESWMMLLDAIWSDPGPRRLRLGAQRGARRGLDARRDVTRAWLEREGLRLLVRSHECVDEGFAVAHDGQVITLFSASNYYEDGSNRAAFLRLSLAHGASLYPFETYEDDVPLASLTLRLSVSRMEQSANEQVKRVLHANKGAVAAALARADPDGTGEVGVELWDELLTAATGLSMPWRATLALAGEGIAPFGELRAGGKRVAYARSLDGLAESAASQAAHHLREMDRVFRIIDADGRHRLGRRGPARVRDDQRVQHGPVEAAVGRRGHRVHRGVDKDGDGYASYREFLDALREGTRGRPAARAPRRRRRATRRPRPDYVTPALGLGNAAAYADALGIACAAHDGVRGDERDAATRHADAGERRVAHMNRPGRGVLCPGSSSPVAASTSAPYVPRSRCR